MKKNIKEISLIVIGLVLASIFVFFMFRAKDDIVKYEFSKNENIYFYVNDIYNEFDSTVTLDKNDNITNLLIDGKVWNSLSEPIYYKNIDKVIFPKNMSIVRPIVGFKQNKIPYYTNIINSDEIIKLKNDNLNYDVENAFFYDGFDLFFFIDETTLKYNDKEIKLSPLSYVKCDYRNYLYVFDYKTKTMNKYDDINSDVLANTQNYSINLSTDTVIVGESSAILSKSIDKLTLLK